MSAVKEFCLNTPDTFWCVVCGYYIHKPVWATILTVLGIVFLILQDVVQIIGGILLGAGIIIFGIAVMGRKRTHDKYELVFVTVYDPNEYEADPMV